MKKRRVLLAILATASAAGALPGLSDPGPALTSLPTAAPAAAPVNPLELDRALTVAAREANAAARELEQVEQAAARSRARTLAYGRAYVRRARAGLLPVGGGFQSLVDHASRLERMRRAAARGLGEQEQLATRRARLARQVESLRARQAQLESQRRALSDARTALMAASDRARAFDRAFTSRGPSAHTAIYGSGVGPLDPAQVAGGFAAMRGRLPFPLPGRSEVASATRPGSQGPGLSMRAPVGSPVRAVYPGRVAFADEYAAYGKTVIIDHGDRYYTVSANLADLGVAAGEDLIAGAPIGTVGDAGRGPELYFEIRRGVETIDPTEWFGI